MRHGFFLAMAAALCACAPAPVQMPASQASEVLNLFAAGQGPANVCSADGRALLRGAVRAYGREMDRSGVAWPMLPSAAAEAQSVTAMDVSVMIAFAAGFVQTSDFQQPTRGFMRQLTFSQWPEIQNMRRAARVACVEVQALQQAASRFVIEQARMADMVESARHRSQGAETVERLRRQSVRVERAQERMQDSAAIMQARMSAAS